jgi:hypothetical protein
MDLQAISDPVLFLACCDLRVGAIMQVPGRAKYPLNGGAYWTQLGETGRNVHWKSSPGKLSFIAYVQAVQGGQGIAPWRYSPVASVLRTARDPAHGIARLH